ncbi:MAG: radical SAM protein [Clostridiales bacterium]|nr:radical SAM protein [Clostridiales bacterium]
MTPHFLAGNLLSLLLRRQVRFEFDRIPLQAERISGRKPSNLFRIILNRLLPISPALGFPYMAHVSPAGLCNLRCPICPAHDPDTRGKTLLPFATFKKLVDEIGDYLIYIILWSWGEPFLNPEIHRMISYAGESNILTVTSSNLNRFGPEEAKKLVDTGLDALIIALDGLSEESYSKYRSGGSARRVVENTRLLVAEKEKRGSKKPFINLRMVVSRENEQEVDEFRAVARELGVNMVSFKAFSTRHPGFADPAIDRRFAPRTKFFRWYDYQTDFSVSKKARKYNCKFPWTKPTLFADGEVLACEFDFRYGYSFGNLNEQSFREIWFGEKAKTFRRRFRRNRDDIAFCRDCVFDYKLIPGCVVEWEILRP